MSIRSKLNMFSKGSIVNGVEVLIQNDGTYVFNFVKLKRVKSSVHTVNEQVGIINIQELNKCISQNEPIVLVVNGKGVINKIVACNDNDSVKILLNKVLPNANENEFSVQKIEINEENSFFSVIRTSVLNDLLSTFSTNKLNAITNCFLGPFTINNSLELIATRDYFTLLNYKFHINNYRIIDFELIDELSDESKLTIGDERIETKSLISFSAALSYFMQSEKGVINDSKLNSIISNSYEKRKFEFRGFSLLGAAFVVLLVNYFVFNNYWTKNNDLVAKLEFNNSSLQKVDTLKAELVQKKEFLEQNGMLENSRTSYYADCLADNLPSSITWTNLDIHPFKKKDVSNESNVLEFENNFIRVSGNCNESIDLNDWMKEIKEYKWVENVELLNYKQENAKENGFFVLEIKLK